MGTPSTKNKSGSSASAADRVTLSLSKADAQNLLVSLAGALGSAGGGKKKKKN